jgi:hypothetical protein
MIKISKCSELPFFIGSETNYATKYRDDKTIHFIFKQNLSEKSKEIKNYKNIYVL